MVPNNRFAVGDWNLTLMGIGEVLRILVMNLEFKTLSLEREEKEVSTVKNTNWSTQELDF